MCRRTETACHTESRIKENSMSILSIANYSSASVGRLPAANCPTCGNGSAAKTSTSSIFTNYKGRTDSFTCVNCGNQKANSAASTLRASSSSSAYCPTCGNNSSARTSFPSSSANTYSCPTCGKGSTAGSPQSSKVVYNNSTTAWAR